MNRVKGVDILLQLKAVLATSKEVLWPKMYNCEDSLQCFCEAS